GEGGRLDDLLLPEEVAGHRIGALLRPIGSRLRPPGEQHPGEAAERPGKHPEGGAEKRREEDAFHWGSHRTANALYTPVCRSTASSSRSWPAPSARGPSSCAPTNRPSSATPASWPTRSSTRSRTSSWKRPPASRADGRGSGPAIAFFALSVASLRLDP